MARLRRDPAMALGIDSLMDAQGYAPLPRILTADECRELREMYADDARFRSRIDMKRYRFGEGEYKYMQYPLPALVQRLREALYPELAVIANRWAESLGSEERYPSSLQEMLERCHEAGQTKATPLILRYETGGYNCLHQDLYGAVAFPMQVVFQLSEPGLDFTGGEFLLVEQRPRAQSAGFVVQPGQGEAVVFTTRTRPVRGTRGWYRVNVKHGVSPLRSGERYTMGLIFHDAA